MNKKNTVQWHPVSLFTSSFRSKRYSRRLHKDITITSRLLKNRNANRKNNAVGEHQTAAKCTLNCELIYFIAYRKQKLAGKTMRSFNERSSLGRDFFIRCRVNGSFVNDIGIGEWNQPFFVFSVRTKPKVISCRRNLNEEIKDQTRSFNTVNTLRFDDSCLFFHFRLVQLPGHRPFQI